MIARYTLPEMGAVWSEKNKFDVWLRIELLACQAQHRLGIVPAADLEQITARAGYDIDEINRIEETVHHDVIAFLTSVSRHVGPSSRFIHLGMTSSDVLDTQNAVCLKQSGELLIRRLDGLREAVKQKALEHKDTVQIGRSHGVHAEPVTFGLKMALMYQELERSRERLVQAVKSVACGKISGAVGTFAHISPEVEGFVCRELGLEAEPVSTQIVQRDRHAQYLATLALVGSSLDKYAQEIRNFQRTEILEAEEGFGKGQKGSSAMPHKRNPIRCERVCGLARVLRGNALVGLENVALWHERDITHSSAERIVLADSSILLDYMLKLMTDVISTLRVYPETMRRNLDRTHGLIFSQRLLLELARRGATRERAYELVQRHAMAAWEGERDFREAVSADPEFLQVLSPGEIAACFDLSVHLRNVDLLMRRAGILS